MSWLFVAVGPLIVADDTKVSLLAATISSEPVGVVVTTVDAGVEVSHISTQVFWSTYKIGSFVPSSAALAFGDATTLNPKHAKAPTPTVRQTLLCFMSQLL